MISPLPNSIALLSFALGVEQLPRETLPLKTPAAPNPAPPVTSRSAWLALEPVTLIVPLLPLLSDAAVTLSDAESVLLPRSRVALVMLLPLVSVPPMLRVVPPSPALKSTNRLPVLFRKVVTLFVPANSKKRPEKLELVIEFTVPIVADADRRRRPAEY